MNSQELIDLEEKYGAHNYHPLDVVITKGDGVWVWDAEGNKYLDCLSAYSALNQGHVHPDILKSLIDQAAKVTLTSRAFRNDQLSLFYKELAEMTGYEMSLPMNSGAEAVETALKLARKWAYTVKGVPRHQAEIIVAEGNFHGRTISIVTFSSEELYKDDFGPFTPGFPMVPYGDLGAMEAAINENTAAIMVEPIQGEGGVLIPPDGYLQGLRELCDKHNILLIFDEIQTGLGRTGKLFAQEHEGVR
ncbi:MAG: aminotransferase class III-fold pyridoxal phosphate-dependent enzyme, partial [Chloroflexi bacterium]|nr:aminotransferase class III-fold pyridoxal phosphate-dependent enzyme [Chloroflexota bacterium]